LYNNILNMSNKKEDIISEIKLIKKEIISDKYSTARDKVNFINEIKNGLGKEIKETGSKVKIIKKSWLERFMANIKKIFTKF